VEACSGGLQALFRSSTAYAVCWFALQERPANSMSFAARCQQTLEPSMSFAESHCVALPAASERGARRLREWA